MDIEIDEDGIRYRILPGDYRERLDHWDIDTVEEQDIKKVYVPFWDYHKTNDRACVWGDDVVFYASGTNYKNRSKRRPKLGQMKLEQMLLEKYDGEIVRVYPSIQQRTNRRPYAEYYLHTPGNLVAEWWLVGISNGRETIVYDLYGKLPKSRPAKIEQQFINNETQTILNLNERHQK